MAGRALAHATRPVKRFYKQAEADAGSRILLDGRPVKTPGRIDLALPSKALAEAIAAEWNAQVDTIDPRAMPLTGLANAAIDRIAPDREAFARGLAAYGESDLVCYRAETPSGLAVRQSEHWDPVLAWARRRYDVDFEIAAGVIHKTQPTHTIARLAHAVAIRDHFQLAGLSPLVTVSGSLLIALALAEEAIDPETAWAAATVDEHWQAEKWGEDAEAARALAARRADFAAGHRFLTLL
jgi:chaperone required for assembly of F1-ATPase